MLNVTCRDLNESIKEILEQIVFDFQQEYPTIDGEAYLGYPIYFNSYTNEKTTVDMAMITKIGVFLFNVLTNQVSDYTSTPHRRLPYDTPKVSFPPSHQ